MFDKVSKYIFDLMTWNTVNDEQPFFLYKAFFENKIQLSSVNCTIL